jgi:hypothetical protein
MVVIEPFKITYDNPIATYQPGDVLCGTLHIGFSESTKVRSKFVQWAITKDDFLFTDAASMNQTVSFISVTSTAVDWYFNVP